MAIADPLELRGDSELKQAALIFDKLVLPGVGGIRWIAETFADLVPDELAAALSLCDFLEESGLVEVAPPQALFPDTPNASESRVLASLFRGDPALRPVAELVRAIKPDDWPVVAQDAWERTARRVASFYREKRGVTAIAVTRGAEGADRIMSSGNDLVARVVISEMPLPDDGTPWEAILDFRSDPMARTKYRRLRVWMNRVTQTERSRTEITDELRYLLDEYEAHMRIHRIKARTGVVHMLLSAAAEILEGIVRLRPTTAARGLFIVREQRVELLEAERSAPGRELAYILDAKRRFGSA